MQSVTLPLTTLGGSHARTRTPFPFGLRPVRLRYVRQRDAACLMRGLRGQRVPILPAGLRVRGVCVMAISRQAQERNRAIVDAHKLSHGCTVCGYRTSAAGLVLDHLDPSNKYRNASGEVVHPANMVRRYSTRTLLAELSKCQVLCATCHGAWTHDAQRKGMEFAEWARGLRKALHLDHFTSAIMEEDHNGDQQVAAIYCHTCGEDI